jgi:hypothetical protein
MTEVDYHRLHPGAPMTSIADNAGLHNESLDRERERRAASYVTGQELDECRQDPKWESEHGVTDHVVCRICGKKIYGILGDSRDGHVGHHGLTWAEYGVAHPRAPRSSLKQRALRMNSSRALRAAAWRPKDWLDKPIEHRIIGNELLSQPGYMSNEDLARRLDGARLLTCPYDGTWGESIERVDFKKFIQKIRKWVHRPGKQWSV